MREFAFSVNYPFHPVRKCVIGLKHTPTFNLDYTFPNSTRIGV